MSGKLIVRNGELIYVDARGDAIECPHGWFWTVTHHQCTGSARAREPAPAAAGWHYCDCRTHEEKDPCERPYTHDELLALVVLHKLTTGYPSPEEAKHGVR